MSERRASNRASGLARWAKKKGPVRNRPFARMLSSRHPFVTVGGGGAVVQPAMLRRESTATIASASFFIKLLSVDAIRTI